MGYGSDVAICIYGPQDKMTAFVAAARIGGYMPDTDFPYSNGFHVFDLEDNKLMIHAYYEGVKWYDGYPEVDTWTAFVEKAAEFDDLSTEFIRIGENYADIEAEQHGTCQYYLGVNRSMQIDIPEHLLTRKQRNQHEKV